MSICENISDIRPTTGRLVAGFDVGRKRDRPALAVFAQRGAQGGLLLAQLGLGCPPYHEL